MNPVPTHHLTFRFPVPGAERVPEGWRLIWSGCTVMGVLNVTPDSFSDGGRHAGTEVALAHARAMWAAGAAFIDVGGESTRPGAEPVPEAEELARVLPVVRTLAAEGLRVSVDTLKPGVADAALEAGAVLVNDVSGLQNPEMRRVCAERGAPACLMHMQGEPRTMQHDPQYADVVAEVFGFLRARAAEARAEGVPGVLLDPGIGFGKTLAHNLSLLRALPELTAGPEPVLVGASRKRFIGTLAGEPDAARRDPGSIAVHLHAAASGAALVRAHDVAGHLQALKVWAALEP